MKLLSIAGTVAMFMVGGGILVHGIPEAHHFIEHIAQNINDVPTNDIKLRTNSLNMI
jgi:uncharacterized protein